MTDVALFLFGQPYARDANDRPVDLSGDKTVALLGYLLGSGKRYTREHLTALLWPDLSPDAARNNLRVLLSRINARIRSGGEPLLLTDRAGVCAHPACELCVDARRFTRLIARTVQHRHADPLTCEPCHRQLSDAIDLYRGEFLDGLSIPRCEAFDDWLAATRETYRQQATQALDVLGAASESHEDHVGAERITRSALKLDPLAESGHRRLMRLLGRQGRRNEAIAHFQRFESHLRDELGVEPDDRTAQLLHQLQSGDFNTASRSPTARSKDAPARPENNLPAFSVRIIGRERELQQLARQAKTSRLVTVLGIGGVGKTRLALQFASDVLHAAGDTTTSASIPAARFDDGVFFVSLQGAESASEIPSAIAQAAHLPALPGLPDQASVARHLADRSVLLVLDNTEHLDGAHRVIDELLRDTRQLTVLTTTRQKLGLSHEAILQLDGLTYPLSGPTDVTSDMAIADRPPCAAVRLFEQTAESLGLAQRLGDGDRACIDRICRQVEGLPLAVKLTASWLRYLSVAEIVDELVAGPATGLAAGATGMSSELHDVPERHRSVHAVFAYSWQLLSPDDRAGYALLAVFSGGFTREAALQVAGVNLSGLSRLIDRSLIQHVPERRRYAFHALVHRFAEGKLQADRQAIATRERHAIYYLDSVTVWAADAKANLSLFDVEFDNLRRA